MKISRETKLIPYIVLCIAAFYAVPFILSTQRDLAAQGIIHIAMLVVINSLISFGGSYVSCFICGFVWYLPFLTGLLFAPAMFIFYDSSCWIYILIYLLFSFLGCFFGAGMRKQRLKNKELKKAIKEVEKAQEKEKKAASDAAAKHLDENSQSASKENADSPSENG